MAGFGFPKSLRLLRRPEFRRVYDTGVSFRNAGFHVFRLDRDDAGPTRLGLTVTSAVGSSVVRNRLRRWAREDFRHWRGEIADGADLVVNMHKRLASRDRHEFDRLFSDVLRRANLLGGPSAPA